jgi:alkylated DNA nucleotide flippase Atl1
MVDEEYVEQVLSLVEQVPSGRVTTYGLIAEALHGTLGRGGPRQVGAVMASYGGPVPWWRVVRSDGSLPDSHLPDAVQEYLAEGTPLRRSGSVDLRSAVWFPDEDCGQTGGELAVPVDDLAESVDDCAEVGESHK